MENKFKILIVSFMLFNYGSAFAENVELIKNEILKFQVNPKTASANFISGKNNQAYSVYLPQGQALSSAIANQFSGEFGVSGVNQELRLIKQFSSINKSTNIRYQQYYKNLPVIGGQVVANTNSSNQLTSMSGETSANLSIDTTTKISSHEAATTALTFIASLHLIEQIKLNATTPVLSIYDPNIFGPSIYGATTVWKIEVKSIENQINEFVLVDAKNGIIPLHFNQFHTLSVRTYTANNTEVIPGTVVCTEANLNCNNGDADAKAAHKYAIDTYNFYLNNHSRDSLDGKGMTLISTVHVGPKGYPNAGWTGRQMIYGDGYSLADDVVAHELTHGVTEFTSNLFYFSQPGAINESLSDVWGEFVDQTNGAGADSITDKWLLGEDLVNNGLTKRVTRSLIDPPSDKYTADVNGKAITLASADKMTSQFFMTNLIDRGDLDNGGVHFNSGVNNKAAYLMAEGAFFNGINVIGMGIEKTAKVYYEVQTKFLTQASNYRDLSYALYQGCLNLIGTNSGITQKDCTDTVLAATTAVEMEKDPIAAPALKAAICQISGDTPSNLFFDNFESGTTNWILNESPIDPWLIKNTNRAPENSVLWALSSNDNFFSRKASMNRDILIPAGAFLHFKQATDFEFRVLRFRKAIDNSTVTQDYWASGGVIEYSVDSGVNWIDAGNLISIDSMNYNGTITKNTLNDENRSNPLGGRRGFVEHSDGYGATRLDLKSLVGQNVRFRWTMGTNTVTASTTGSTGWFIDDVRVYTCSANNLNQSPVINTTVIGSTVVNGQMWINANTLVALDASASLDQDTNPLTYAWTQVGASTVVFSGNDSEKKFFVVPPNATTLTFQLTVNDGTGNLNSVVTKMVTLNVNNLPVINLTANEITVSAGELVILEGNGLDVDSNQSLTYQWLELGSDSKVLLTESNTKIATFTAPSLAVTKTLKFLLQVSDGYGGAANASVTVIVKRPVLPGPILGGSGGSKKSGGCVINKKANFDPLLPSLFILGLIFLFRKTKTVNVFKV